MRSGFTILEVILALAIVALVMAALGPALVGSLRAERQARAVLGPLADEPAALARLREDLLAAPRPVGTLAQPFTLAALLVDGRRGAELQVFTVSSTPLHPSLAVRAPDTGQAVVTWEVRRSDDGRGLAWTRASRSDLLATGTLAEPVGEVLLDHLAQLSIEVFIDGGYTATYDSSTRDALLPTAVRVTWAPLNADGSSGPLRLTVIGLPQVVLDPLQSEDES